MPFVKIDAKKIVKEKRKDKEFDEAYKSVRIEYMLIKEIVEARKAHGLTQKEIAKNIGVEQQTISRFEKEKHIPNLSTFIKILDEVGLEINLKKKKSEEKEHTCSR